MKRYALSMTVASFVIFVAGSAYAVPFDDYWVNVSGSATSIGSAAGETWIISNTPQDGNGNYYIYRWNGAGWDLKPNSAAQITVSAGGVPWVLRADGSIWKWTGSSFTQPNGIGNYNGGSSCAKAIAVGFGDDAWITSCGAGADTSIFHWNGSQWVVPSQGGSAKYLGMFISGTTATPWAVQNGGSIYQWTSGGWVGQGSGGKSITDQRVVASGYRYLWTGSAWQQELAAPSGKTYLQLADNWAITTDHSIYLGYKIP